MNPANALVSGFCFGLAAFVDIEFSIALVTIGVAVLWWGAR